MNTASILIKTDPQVKTEAQKVAKELGLSLNVVVTRLLKRIFKKKDNNIYQRKANSLCKSTT